MLAAILRCMAILGIALSSLSPVVPAVAAEPRIRYSVSAGVAADDEAIARSGIELAQSFVEQAFGAGLADDLVVNVRPTANPGDPSVLAFASGGYLVVFTGAPGWPTMSPALRLQVIVHEYVHIYQHTMLGYDLGDFPFWFIEGMAEYSSYDALESLGIIDHRAVIDEQSRRYAQGQRWLDPLADLADIDAFQKANGPVYSLAYLAVGRLAGDDGEAALQRYFARIQHGTPWRDAFVTAFGLEIDDFYADFDRWLADDLIAPTKQPAAFREIEPQRLAADVAIASAPATVAEGEQFAVVAETEPFALCRFELRDAGGDNRATFRTVADATGRVFWLADAPADPTSDPLTVTAGCGATRDRVSIAVTDAK